MAPENWDDGFVSLRVSARYVIQVTCDSFSYLFRVRRNRRESSLQCHSFFSNKSKRLHKTSDFRDTRNRETG